MLVVIVKKHMKYFEKVLAGGKFEALKRDYEKKKYEEEHKNKNRGGWAQFYRFEPPENQVKFLLTKLLRILKYTQNRKQNFFSQIANSYSTASITSNRSHFSC